MRRMLAGIVLNGPPASGELFTKEEEDFYTFAAVRRSAAASVFSQENSGSSLPKCP